MKVVELHEDKAKQAREEASKAGHEILTKAEDMKQMLIHAKEAKEKVVCLILLVYFGIFW